MGVHGDSDSSEEEEQDQNKREPLKTVEGQLAPLTYILTAKSPKSAFDCL